MLHLCSSLKAILFFLLSFIFCSHSLLEGRDVSENRRALSKAIDNKDAFLVKSLIESNSVGIDELSASSETPLMEAAYWSDLAAVHYLIEKGANVNCKEDFFSKTALSEAMSAWKFSDEVASEIIQALIQAGANVNVPQKSSNPTPFMKACELHAVKCVNIFLENGIDLETKTSKGKTALMFAMDSGKTHVLSLLINKGAKLETKDVNGRTALFYALCTRSPLLVNFMIDAGANTLSVDYNGTPVFMHALSTGVPAITGLFLQLTPDIKIVNYKNESALFFIARTNDLNTARYLIQQGLEVDQKNSDGETPFLKAAMANQTAMALFLYENGADVTVKTYKGWTAVNSVAENGNLRLLQLLVEKKAPLDTRDSYSFTPLMKACMDDKYDVAACLIAGGANTKAWTTDSVSVHLWGSRKSKSRFEVPSGSTPIDIAKIFENERIIKLLDSKN